MHDLIIIGSGPAGLSAAVYAVRSGLDVIVIEQNIMSGGQIINTYEVDNYLGMPGISGFDMAMKFREHVDKLGVVFKEGKVISIENLRKSKLVHTKNEDYEAKSIILATGAKSALLNAPGEERFTGKGVSYCATCDGAFYKGKTVAVNGGGDAALEDAVYLSKICKKVYLIHRRDEFRGTKILQEEVRAIENIHILYSHEIMSIKGNDMVESINVYDVKNNEEKDLKVDGVFVAVGVAPQTELVKGMVNMDEKGYVLAGEDCASSISGLFVAGDIRKKPMRQIITAVADGANAAASAKEFCMRFK